MNRPEWINYYRGQAARYHDRAEECLTLSDQAHSQEGSRGFRVVAECYMRLAHQAEHSIDELEAKAGVEPACSVLQTDP